MEMKKTEIGMIPEEWNVQSFSDTFRILNNNTYSRAELNYASGQFRNIHYGDVLILFPEVLDCTREDVPYINDDVQISGSAQSLQDGDIVMADTAEDATVGKITEVINTSDKPVMAGLHTIPCRVKSGEFATGWLGYYMNSHMYHDQLLPFIHGIKVSSISKGALKDTYIAVPSKPEQEKIVEALSDVDALIADTAKLVKKYQQIKQGCLSKMFPRDGKNVPEMRLPGFTGAWEQRKLGEICLEMVAGGDIDKEKLSDEGNFPVLANALTNDGIVGYYENDYRVKAPAVTVTGRGDVGHAKARKVNFTPVVRLLALRTDHDVDFVENAINTLKIVVESTGVPQLTVPQLEKHELCVPSTIEEEKAIGTYFRTLDHLITLHQRKLEKYKNIKQGMMEELLTGKVRLI